MKLKIDKATALAYKKPAAILVVSILVAYGLNNFVTAPRVSASAAVESGLQDTKKNLALMTKRLSDLDKTGLDAINANYKKIAALDAQVPQLPSEQVKANLIAQFVELATRSGAAGNIFFTNDVKHLPSKNGIGLAATFNVKGTAPQIAAFLKDIGTLNPLTVVDSITYTDSPDPKGDVFGIAGGMTVVGVSSPPLPLDASGNPPAPGK